MKGLFGGLLGLGLVLATTHCGGRTLDASSADDDMLGPGRGVGGAGGKEQGAGGQPGAGGDLSGVGGGGAAGGDGEGFDPLDCFGCIAQECPVALECIQDPACAQGLGCTVTNYLGSGDPDLACVTECFDGDLEAGLKAFEVLGCIFGSCGDPCQGALPF